MFSESHNFAKDPCSTHHCM